ncbi:hypothetical protein ABIX84_002234 [Escherichia coli]|uniref:GIY-YIG nuclease family protein n=1 Tax=Escherichia marmotae TaxID=1499973 RepID=UPI001C9A3791|nr:GIY-YIG nuclease family protein [Escherichia marmotae]EEZ1009351.1 hypothetical protein [Escherichia coli]EKH4138272.1 hypothetical protein [Escherichia coli]MBY7303122.1 hypothetical protein [Escherichia marmotae]HAY4689409.1 hypothetical protein [Escherichia coli]HBJ0172038.1 hypothetical protein [Escherichia coli]
MEIRSIVVLRKAKDIEFVKRASAKPPTDFEYRAIKIASERGYTYLGFVGDWKGRLTKCLISCDSGHYFTIPVTEFIRGHGCGKCAGNQKRTEEQALREAHAEAKKRGDCVVVGFDGGYRGCDFKNLNVECMFHSTFKTSLLNFLRDVKCPTCAGNQKRTEEQALREAIDIAIKCGTFEVVGFDGGYKTVNTNNLVCRCYEHGEVRTSLTNILRKDIGLGCCVGVGGYDKNKPGYFYIQNLSGAYVKFGITNHVPEKRMSRQQSTSKYVHSLVTSRYFDDGNDAFELERLIKKTFPIKVVTKDYLPDGYTETVNISALNELRSIMLSYA